jgi:branched-chain amino acid transport system substrate-binding protein
MAVRPHDAAEPGQGQALPKVRNVVVHRLWVWAALLLACAGPGAAQEPEGSPLLIGLLLPPEEPASASLRQGAQLAIEHANHLPGPKAGLIVRGRAGQWGDDGVEAARMVLDDGARGLIAPSGGAASHLSLQVAGRTAIPVVSLCGDSSVTGAGIPWMVRLAPRTIDQARAILAVAPLPGLPPPGPSATREAPPPSRRHATRWAAVVPGARAGREATRDLEAAARATGCVLQKPVEVTTNLTAAGTLVRQVLTNQPDGVLLWLDPAPAGRLASLLRAAGFAGRLAGPDQLQSDEFLQAAGPAAEGVVLPTVVRDESSRAVLARFGADYRNRYQSGPDISAALAYDAALLLTHILRKSGTETPHRAFPLVETLPGASGSLAFDREGNRKVTLNLLVCHNGKFTILPATP